MKDIVAILHLLVNLATHYRAPIRFPNNVNVQILIYQRNGKQINKNIVTEQITTKQTELAPMVKFLLITFLINFICRENAMHSTLFLIMDQTNYNTLKIH